jgi:hypothetical protein
MTFEEAIKVISKRIYKNGEVTNGDGCLVPRNYANSTYEFNIASSVIHDKTQATHYNLEWMNDNKNIKVTLFENEAFGASAEPMTPRGEYIL